MSSKASKKIIEKFENSCNNVKRKEIVRVYKANGFAINHGGKHDKIYHPEFPQLITFLPRHNSVLPIYCKILLKNIKQLIELQETKSESAEINSKTS